MFDSKGRFLRWNKNLEAISENSAEEVRNANPLDYFSGEVRAAPVGIMGREIFAGLKRPRHSQIRKRF